MSSVSFSVQIVDNITNYGITTLDVWLYKYPATVNSLGVITGTKAKDINGADIRGVHKGGGVYEFTDVPSGEYTVVVGSSDITTRVLEGYARYIYVNISGKDILAPSDNGSGIIVSDKTTGTKYRICVNNGALTIEVV